MPATTDTMIITMNITSQLARLWLTFHQMIVNSSAQMNTTMSRQFPVYDIAAIRISRLRSSALIRASIRRSMLSFSRALSSG